MNVSTICDYIKNLIHDRGMSSEKINMFINQAVAELRGVGYLSDSIHTDEIVTVADGATVIVTSCPVKSVLKCSAEITADSAGIRLLSPADGDVQITITYVAQIPDWDGTEDSNVLDPWLYIYGGTYYACAQKMAPDTIFYRQQLDKQIARVFGDSVFMGDVPDAMSSEVLGI